MPIVKNKPIINIPVKDRGEIYSRVAEKFAVSKEYVAQVNNRQHKNLRIIEALIYEGAAYEKWRDNLLKKIGDA